jgi:hypothetical protein
VLEEASGVAVMAVGCRRDSPETRPELDVADELGHRRLQAGVGDLAGEELEEAVELVDVATEGRGERGRILDLDGLERPDLELKAVAEALDAAENADGVALAKTAVEKLDVVPDACLDAPARVDQLQREIRSAASCPQLLLAGDRVDPLDDAVFGELGDSRHAGSLGPKSDARVKAPWPR